MRLWLKKIWQGEEPHAAIWPRPIVVALFWALVFLGFTETRLYESIGVAFAHRTEFALRSFLGKDPKLDSRLQIFSLDDSAYALLRRPYLTGSNWARVLESLAEARPKVIATTHMFGTGETSDDGGRLKTTLLRLRAQGISVIAGGFVYPNTIAHREPLDPLHSEFRQGWEAPELVREGWRLYGPDAVSATFFSAIGHLAYEGDGRMAPFVRLAKGHSVPHLSVAVLGALSGPTDKSRGNHANRVGSESQAYVDQNGRTLINFSEPASYKQRTRSLRVLLTTDGLLNAKRFVQPGDVVLVLLDMYTGRANFNATPVGQMPGGFVAAAALNTVLTQEWLSENESRLIPIVLGSATGALVTGAGVFAPVTLLIGGALVIALGCLSFTLFATSWAWLLMLFSLLATGVTCFLRSTSLRLAAERFAVQRAGEEAARLSAIVRTAQMFAHDVRKPFSLLNMATQALGRHEDPEAKSKVLATLIPELERTMSAVDGMLQDVMEIDGSAPLMREQVNVEALLSDAMREAFLIKPEAQILIDYEFGHSVPLLVDPAKVRRVLVNIVDNAVDAMQGQGHLRIETRDTALADVGMIEIKLINNGPLIASELTDRIFEAFFTHGKKGGTGLGLAIAHKVVTSHGGTIRCESSVAKGTAFIFTLPMAKATPQMTPQASVLPATAAAFRAPKAKQNLDAQKRRLQAALVHAAAVFTARIGRAPRILLVDDETLYLQSMAAVIRAGTEGSVTIVTAHDAKAAALEYTTAQIDVAILDVDLAGNENTGLDIARELKIKHPSAYLIIHSNRVLPLDERRALKAGSDIFLPKPLDLVKLQEHLLRALSRHPSGVSRPVVAVIEDNAFARDAWEKAIDDAEVLFCSGPADFWRLVGEAPELLAKLSCVITDFYFESEATDGMDLALQLRRKTRIPIVLASDGFFEARVRSNFTLVMAKEPCRYAVIQRQLQQAS